MVVGILVRRANVCGVLFRMANGDYQGCKRSARAVTVNGVKESICEEGVIIRGDENGPGLAIVAVMCRVFLIRSFVVLRECRILCLYVL